MKTLPSWKRNRNFFLHTLFWISLTVFSYGISVIQDYGGGAFVEDAIGKYLVASLIFYTCSDLIFPHFFSHRKYFLTGLGLFSLLLVSYLVKCILYIIIFPLFGYPELPYTLVEFFIMNLWWWFQYSMFGIGYWYTLQALQGEKKKVALEAEKIKAEFSYLRAQVDPHFLYNVLNLFYSKALLVSEELADKIVTLADIMRYSLSANGPDGKIEIVKEVEQIKNVIEINKMRFDDDIVVEFISEGNYEEIRIIPFILITLVENAFKHGEFMKKEPLLISIRFDDELQKLHMVVKNSKSHKPNWESFGIGLENVRNRLDIEYGKKYSLVVNENDNFFMVVLDLEI